MDSVYLDYNCFQRSFDDPSQIKIKLESMTCEEIFIRAERRSISLVWSFMHEDENILCPFIERKLEVYRLSFLCEIKIEPNIKIYNLAKNYQRTIKLSSKDSIHLACACHCKSKFFLTCDDDIIKRTKKANLNLKILNPVDYVRGGC